MMTIKNFVEGYNAISTNTLKEQYIKDNLHINTYVPFLKKVTLADKLVKITTFDSNTGNINVKSDVSYLLFCRMLIEQYTDIQVETEGFYEEYDLLKQSGLLDKLMMGTENEMPLIPVDEIMELRNIVEMKQRDALTNYGSPQNYIANQIERVSTIFSVALSPALEKISEQLENLDDSKISKIEKSFDRLLKKINK